MLICMCVCVRACNSESAHLFSMQIHRLGFFSHANANWLVVRLHVFDRDTDGAGLCNSGLHDYNAALRELVQL